jgi:hypothetical protein
MLKQLSETAKPQKGSGGLALGRKRLRDMYLRPAIERDRHFQRATPLWGNGRSGEGETRGW